MSKKRVLIYKRAEAMSGIKSGGFFIGLGVIGSIMSRLGYLPPLWAWSLAFIVAGAGLKTVLDLIMLNAEIKRINKE